MNNNDVLSSLILKISNEQAQYVNSITSILKSTKKTSRKVTLLSGIVVLGAAMYIYNEQKTRKELDELKTRIKTK